MVRIFFLASLLTVGSCFLLENVLHLEVDCNDYKDKCDHNILEFLWEVCGSDGVTYPNSCDLAKEKCFQHNDVHIKHVGKCKKNEVSPVTTEPGTTGDPKDVLCLQLAYEDCPTSKEEVCGSDGRTYTNLCEFQKAACMHKSLTASSFGVCKS